MSFAERFLTVIENRRLQLTLLVAGIFGGALGYFLSETIEPRYPVAALIRIGTDLDGRPIEEASITIEKLKTVEFITALAEHLENPEIILRLNPHKARMSGSVVRGAPLLRVVVAERSEEESKRVVAAVAKQIISYHEELARSFETRISETAKKIAQQDDKKITEQSDKGNKEFSAQIAFVDTIQNIEIRSEQYKLQSKLALMIPTNVIGYVSEQNPLYPILRPIRFTLMISIGLILSLVIFFMFVSVGSPRKSPTRGANI